MQLPTATEESDWFVWLIGLFTSLDESNSSVVAAA
jgi:hypothetical protein